MVAREEFLAIKTPDEYNKFREKYPNLKLNEFDAEMAKHFNYLLSKWSIPKEVNGIHIDIRKKTETT